MSFQSEKTILVLANSIKKGGRCVAGLEVVPMGKNLWQKADWIRPYDPEQDEGTIPNDRVFVGGTVIKPLDLISISFLGSKNDPHHPEDMIIDGSRAWRRISRMPISALDRLEDESEDLWGRDSALSRKVSPLAGMKTLRIIKPRGNCVVKAFAEQTAYGLKYRRFLHLDHDGTAHVFSIDDPVFTERNNITNRQLSAIPKEFELDPAKTVVIASLTKPFGFDRKQYKIAANIFQL